MSNVYLLADLHHHHENIAQHRGFPDAATHDALIKKNWNKTIHKRDTVYILGDLTMENGKYDYLSELHGRKIIVGGNHDLYKDSKKLMEYVEGIAGVVKYKGVFLTHVPIHPCELEFRVPYNIHGHMHENIVDDTRYFNVSCEQVNYTPVSFSTVLTILRERNGNTV